MSPPPFFECEKGESMNVDKKRNDRKSRIISRQVDEIDKLKQTISDLEISCQEKDELIGSIDALLSDMKETVNGIKKKSDEYDKLVDELKQMKKIMNEEVFNNKWWLIKFLLR